MQKPYPDGPGDGHQLDPGGSRRRDRGRRDDDWPDHAPDDEWFRPRRGQERGPGPQDVPDERGRHHRQGERRRPAPNRTKALNLQATSLDLNATSVDLPAIAPELLEPLKFQERKAGGKWMPIAGTALFVIDTAVMADGFAHPVAIGTRVLVIFIWLVSLAAAALLWLRAFPKLLEQRPLTRIVRIIRVVRAEIKANPGDGDAIVR